MLYLRQTYGARLLPRRYYHYHTDHYYQRDDTMGKTALLLVLVSIYGWTLNSSTQSRNYLEREDEQAFYQEKVLARERAMSGFNVVVTDTENDFDNFRLDLLSNQYRDGTFSISAIGGSGDTVTVLATGSVGRADYTIVADMVREASSPLSALNISGPVSTSLGNGNSFEITGYDTNPGDAVGSGNAPDTYGINAMDTGAMIAMQGGLDADQVTGKGGGNSFSDGFSVKLVQLENDIATHPLCVTDPARCPVFNGNQRFTGNDTFGSPEAPVIVTVNGDVEFKGNVTGYGILRVKGQFATVTGTPRWEGLVYASTNGGLHELRGNPKIYGALILESITDQGGPGAEMSFKIRGNAALYYSSMALDRIPVLNSIQVSGPAEVQLLNIRQASAEATDYVGLQSN
ncbi:MAG: hypothetical protein BMS9Abin05_0052 [Rhodothermia bacterium]|nr:MAG: hypothetical protein BMS9Abin05_0052 [Rhodothermia bacterium]